MGFPLSLLEIATTCKLQVPHSSFILPSPSSYLADQSVEQKKKKKNPLTYLLGELSIAFSFQLHLEGRSKK